MNRIATIMTLAGLSAAALLSSCRGQSGTEEQELFLLSDKTAIVADGSEKVTFTVMSGSTDVTASATVTCTTTSQTVPASGFSTTSPGTYSFMAQYGGRESDQVTVRAEAPKTDNDRPVVESRFVRHVCVMEFTGQWCAQCPDGYNSMQFVISRNFDGVAHIMALHDNTSGSDEFALSVQNDISLAYGISGYPTCLVDMRDVADPKEATLLRQTISSSIEDYTPYCGVSVSSDYNEGTGAASVEVKLFSEFTSQYRIAVWIVEDNIVASQNVNGVYYDEYVHHHVVRRQISESWRGDSIGSVAEGEEGTISYTVPVAEEWNLDNVEVYALAIDTDGYVNNMAVCPLVDGDSGYDLK